jgi:hypothetical protein
LEFATVTSDDFTVESNTATEAQLRENFEATPAPSTGAKPAADATVVDAPKADDLTDGEDAPASDAKPADRNPDGTFKAKDGDKPADAKADEKPKEGEKPKSDKPRDNPQARVEQAVARMREAERRAELAERRAADLEAARTPKPEPTRETRPAPQAQGDPSDPEPQEAGFDDYAKYVKAQARWEARQEFKAQQTQARDRYEQEQTARLHQERADTYLKRIQTAVSKDPELLTRIAPEVLELKPSIMLGPNERPTGATAIADIVMDAENPEALMLYFTEHPDDFQRLSTLHPIQVIREMGRLEARLDAARPAGTAPTAPLLSQAKPPVRPVTGSPSAAVDDLDPDSADFDAWKRQQDAKDRGARRGR